MKIPVFKNEDEEAAFWDSHEVTDYVQDLTEVENTSVSVMAHKKRKKSVTFRIEEDYIEQLKELAEIKAIGYQSLMRMIIVEKLREINKTDKQ